MGSTTQRWARVVRPVVINRFTTLFFALALLGIATPVFSQTASHITVRAATPGGTVGIAYHTSVLATGGISPYAFSISTGNLPTGLSLDHTTGLISGTPTKTGSFPFTVWVVDAKGLHGDRRLSIDIAPGNISVTISPSSATIASAASQQFTALVSGTSSTGVTWTTTAGQISTSGLFSAPSTTTTISALVTATSTADPTKKGSANVTITPAASAPTITTSSLPAATAGSAYTAGLTATGGSTPYHWALASGSLPSGIALDSTTGTIAGSTSALGTFNFAVKLTDSAGNSDTQSLSLVVSNASANFDGPAELPRAYVQSTMANSPAPGSTVFVPAGGNLQTALNSANCGDTISLQAGATFSGKFTLPAKACDNAHWIIIRTSAPDSSLPPEGTRITPCSAGVSSLPGRPAFSCPSAKNVLAQISFPTGGAQSGPLAIAPGANHYRLLGLEITRPVGTGSVSNLIGTGQTGTADHIIIDRCWIHGTTHDETRTGVSFRGVTDGAVIDSYVNDLHCISSAGACTDAVTIGGGNGSNPTGPWKIVNNFLEASGENILLGGAAATITPADIEIRRNHFFKPLLWMPGVPGFIGGPAGNPFIVKNHIEFKNAQRVLIEANIFENSWGGFSQFGTSIILSPRNQQIKSTSTNVCPTCTVTDITIRYSTISHVGSGMHMSTSVQGTTYALSGARFSIHDIVIDDVDGSKYKGGGTVFKVANGRPTDVLNSVTINHVTGFADPNGTLLAVGDPVVDPKMWGFVFTNNLATAGRYPLWSVYSGTDCSSVKIPTTALPACFSSYAFKNNAIIATPSQFGPSTWPSGNWFPTTASSQFVNYNNGNGGDYHLLSSSPYVNAGSDGKDLGADLNAIATATAGVY